MCLNSAELKDRAQVAVGASTPPTAIYDNILGPSAGGRHPHRPGACGNPAGSWSVCFEPRRKLLFLQWYQAHVLRTLSAKNGKG